MYKVENRQQQHQEEEVEEKEKKEYEAFSVQKEGRQEKKTEAIYRQARQQTGSRISATAASAFGRSDSSSSLSFFSLVCTLFILCRRRADLMARQQQQARLSRRLCHAEQGRP